MINKFKIFFLIIFFFAFTCSVKAIDPKTHTMEIFHYNIYDKSGNLQKQLPATIFKDNDKYMYSLKISNSNNFYKAVLARDNSNIDNYNIYYNATLLAYYSMLDEIDEMYYVYAQKLIWEMLYDVKVEVLDDVNKKYPNENIYINTLKSYIQA